MNIVKPNLECFYCRGTLERGTTLHHVDREGYHLILERVPAWVCTQCGEACFTEADVDAIQDVIRALDEKVQQFKSMP